MARLRRKRVCRTENSLSPRKDERTRNTGKILERDGKMTAASSLWSRIFLAPSSKKFLDPGSRSRVLARHRYAFHKAQNLPKGRLLCLLWTHRESDPGLGNANAA